MECQHGICPACGCYPVQGIYRPGDEVACAGCGDILVVTRFEPCRGTSEFVLATDDQSPPNPPAEGEG